MKESAKGVIVDFFKKYFHIEVTDKSIEELKSFDFFKLWEMKDEEFGYKNINYQCCCKFDGDRTILAKAIYYLIWEDLPGISQNEKIQYNDILIGSEYDTAKYTYSGDTLNTFATLFSYRSLTEDIFNNDELYSAIQSFKRKYLTIGNFILLPKISFNRQTMNTYRGFNLKDYFDIFLFQLQKCLNGENDKDVTLTHIIKENNFYFTDKIKINEFIKINFLEKYYDYEKNTINTFAKQNFLKPLDVYSSKNNFLLYKEFALGYIEKSIEIIDDRANKMINILKKKF